MSRSIFSTGIVRPGIATWNTATRRCDFCRLIRPSEGFKRAGPLYRCAACAAGRVAAPEAKT